MTAPETEIAAKADFDLIRYAQVWEDADVLVAALGAQRGNHLVSIASAGDNALALLTLDPALVVALDISPAQIECVRLRIAAYQTLSHTEFLELMGSRPSNRRGALLAKALADTTETTQTFWAARKHDVEKYGAGGVGKFERYFRAFQRYVLPLTHSRRTIKAIFEARDPAARREFFDRHFDNWRWRILMRVFFSRFMMARLGRDPAFFDHVDGSVADHVAARVRHASVACNPSRNPYLHWVLTGTHGKTLPLAWRVENYDLIRSRLDRLTIRQGSLEDYLATAPPIDGFNLSDIFEYMGPETFDALYGKLIDAAAPAARLVYWNMMVPRRAGPSHQDRVTTLSDLEEELKARDAAFFYSDLVIEEVR